ERLAGRSMSPEQLAHRRRLGTILAALLFALAGLTLALTIELQTGLKLVDVERVRVWVTIKAALGNAAVILGWSTVFESLLWLWRELGLKDPVLDWTPGP